MVKSWYSQPLMAGNGAKRHFEMNFREASKVRLVCRENSDSGRLGGREGSGAFVSGFQVHCLKQLSFAFPCLSPKDH